MISFFRTPRLPPRQIVLLFRDGTRQVFPENGSHHLQVEPLHDAAMEVSSSAGADEDVAMHADNRSKEKSPPIITVLLKCLKDDCDDWATDEDRLKDHMLEEHDMTEYRCLIRGCEHASFQYRQDLTDHLAEMHDEAKNACVGCEKSYKRYYDLQKHFHQAHELGHFICSKCPFESFTNRQVILKHMKIHNLGIICEHPNCQKVFFKQSEYTRHVDFHLHVKHFICSHCGKGFTLKGDLKKHDRIHLGLKPWFCTWKGCQEHFEASDRSAVIGHIKRKHLKNKTENAKVYLGKKEN